MATESSKSGTKVPFLMFVVGLIAGIVGTVIIPNLARPYLPDAIGGSKPLFHGIVTGKRVEAGRVLLTLPTEGGTVLATFTREVGEIDLMIQEGDSLVLEVDEYEPFVENPRIARVVTLSSPLTDRTTDTTATSATSNIPSTGNDSVEMPSDSAPPSSDTSRR